MFLHPNWNNEAYVSLHLVQKILEEIGLPKKSDISHWYPQYSITIPTSNKKPKAVDFLIEDYNRKISFLIEVKSANLKIDDTARFQLNMYLQYSKIKYGILIDPFLVETYEFIKGRARLQDKFEIKEIIDVKPTAIFIKKFLDTIKRE